MNDRKKTIEVVSIDFPTGSTPMTIAETIVRSCSDIEWIKDIIYWLCVCYFERGRWEE